MEKCTPLNEMLKTTMEHLRGVTDANTIIGAPIHADGVTLIPVSKLSVGVGGGGTEFSTKNQSAGSANFGGGSAASAKLEPVAFLVVQNGGVKLLPVTASTSAVGKMIDTVPEVVDKITGFVEKQQEKKAQAAAAADFAD